MKNSILENLIPKFLDNIDSSEKEFMKNMFIEYFNNRYKNINENDINHQKREILSNLIIKQELAIWENGTLNQKKSLIINDPNLTQLFIQSNNAFSLALNRLNSNVLIKKEKAVELKKQLEETYNKIESYNKKNAEMTLSESLLDLEYASGNINDVTSLRLAKEINNK